MKSKGNAIIRVEQSSLRFIGNPSPRTAIQLNYFAQNAL